MEKALLAELLDGLTAVHSFLAKDIAKDKLSSKNHKARNSFVQRLDDLIRKVREANSAANGPPPITSEPPLPTTPQRPSLQSKPPPIPPPISIEDEGGEMYEVPENVTSAATEHVPSEYSDFLPVTLDDPHDEPQEEYLAMEADQREEITEETYEDPSQTAQDPEPDLYEDPQVQSSNQPPPTQQMSGYMEPVKLAVKDNTDNRKSVVPVDLIDDWECAYDSTNIKKKEKVKASKLKNITMKGWLEKLGGRSHKNWQKRYCVLSDMFMYFYEKEGSSTYNNRIPVLGFFPNPSPELTLPKKNQFAFKLTSADSNGKAKDYYFRSKSESERDKWVEEVRTIYNQGMVTVSEKRKSMTLPSNLGSSRSSPSLPNGHERTPSVGFEQEEYEAITAATIPEEDDEQEEYIDVSQANEAITSGNNEDSQEEYMDVNVGGGDDEPQEDYVVPEEIRPTMERQTASTSSMPPLPPPPGGSKSSASKLPLPPPPPSENSSNTVPPPSSVTQQPLPAPPPGRRPDPVVDTSKVYVQQQNGIQYDKVYVMLWDFDGVDKDEINVKRGDLLLVKDPNKGQEWWIGELLSQDCSKKLGQMGLFPASYCSLAFEVA